MMVLVFSSPLVFTLEFTPAQLVDSHSSTPKSTKASLCTCCVKKNVVRSNCGNHMQAMFLSVNP
jgi:hypothetical protein